MSAGVAFLRYLGIDRVARLSAGQVVSLTPALLLSSFDLFTSPATLCVCSPYRREASTFSLRVDGNYDVFQGCKTLASTNCSLYNPAYCTNPSILCSPGLIATVFPSSVTTVDGFHYYETIVGTGGGIRYYNRSAESRTPTPVLTDATDYGRVQAWGGSLFFFSLSGGPGGVSAMYRIDALPRALIATGRGTPIFANAVNNWNDFDIGSRDFIAVGAQSGLQIWRFSAANNAWSVTENSVVANIIGVAVDAAMTTVLVTTATDMYSFNVGTGAYNNNDMPIVSAPGGFAFRGVAFNPVIATSTPTASVTPSNTVTPSNPPSSTSSVSATATVSISITASASATISSGASISSTATNTPSPSQTGTMTSSRTGTVTTTSTTTGTPSITTTPTGTMTQRAGAMPTSGFILVTIGNGAQTIPNTARDITTALTVSIYSECGSGCSSPTLRSTITPWSSLANNGADRWGNRFMTLNTGSVGCNVGSGMNNLVPGSGCFATYRNGRVVPSDNRGSVIIPGYDVYAVSSGTLVPSLASNLQMSFHSQMPVLF